MAAKILLVDDAVEILSLIETILTSQGFQVITAVNGVEALEKVHAEAPDVIITDVMMPEMDGYAFFKELKRNPSTENIPILILTARGKMEDSFLALGAKDFITKPFETDDLLAKVNAWLERKVARSEGSAVSSVSSPETARAGRVKVMAAGSHGAVLEKMAKLLRKKSCLVETAGTEGDILRALQTQVMDALLLEVLVEGRPSQDLIRRIRRIRGWEQKPIILFSVLDRDEDSTTSVHQQALAIEKARTACMEAGATSSLGGFDESRFLAAVKLFLPE